MVGGNQRGVCFDPVEAIERVLLDGSREDNEKQHQCGTCQKQDGDKFVQDRQERHGGEFCF